MKQISKKAESTSIREILRYYAKQLSKEFPNSPDVFRWKTLAETCEVYLIPKEYPVCTDIEVPYMDRFCLLIKARNQVVDISPSACGDGHIELRKPMIVLYEDASESGIFHEASHLISIGHYWERDGAVFHKRGMYTEKLEKRGSSYVTVHTCGDLNTNEAATDLCGEHLMKKFKGDDSCDDYVKNQNYRSFLKRLQLEGLEKDQARYAYLHDSFGDAQGGK